MRRLISSGSPLEAAVGYSRAVVDGEWIFVAGTTGFDYAQMTIAEDPAEQARQAFRNIEQALAEAGGTLADVVRVHYYVPDITDWPAIAPVLGEVFSDPPGRHGTRLRPRRSADENRDRGHRQTR